jgi:hypothetical protein
MKTLVIATAATVLAAPAGATTATISGSVTAPNVPWSDLTEVVLPDFFPGYAPQNGQYSFTMTLSRPADVATIVTYDYTSFIYEEWWPGHYWSGGDDYGIEMGMVTTNNANVIRGTFTAAAYHGSFSKGPWDNYSRYREWFSSRPTFAYLTFSDAGPVDYTVTISGAVPEPANWALMVTGFGLLGAALRHQHAGRRKFACL